MEIKIYNIETKEDIKKFQKENENYPKILKKIFDNYYDFFYFIEKDKYISKETIIDSEFYNNINFHLILNENETVEITFNESYNLAFY